MKSNHAKMAVAGGVRAVVFLSLTTGIFAALGAAMTYGLPKLGQHYSQVANFLQQHSQALATAQQVNLYADLVITGFVAGFLVRQAYTDHRGITSVSSLEKDLLSSSSELGTGSYKPSTEGNSYIY